MIYVTITPLLSITYSVETSGLEPPTPSLQSYGHPDASEAGKGLTPTPPAACSAACTSKPENSNACPPEAGNQEQGFGTATGTFDADPETPAGDQGDPLAKLAAALMDLTPADRARLAAMLG